MRLLPGRGLGKLFFLDTCNFKNIYTRVMVEAVVAQGHKRAYCKYDSKGREVGNVCWEQSVLIVGFQVHPAYLVSCSIQREVKRIYKC